MMPSLFAMAAAATHAVLPCIVATLRMSDGYDTQPDGTTRPRYNDVLVSVRIQPASAADLALHEGLGQNTLTRTVYMPGEIKGVDRAHQFGGDLLLFEGATWLVTGQPELWSETQGGVKWSRLLVTRQEPPSQNP